MTAVAKVLSRAPATQGDVETLQTLALYCGIGLVASAVIIERPGLERQFLLTASQGDVP
jgi:hypothetical protein